MKTKMISGGLALALALGLSALPAAAVVAPDPASSMQSYDPETGLMQPEAAKFVIQANLMDVPVFKKGKAVDFSWKAVEGAAKYEYRIQDLKSKKTVVARATKKLEGKLDANMAKAGSYKVTVKLMNADGKTLVTYTGAFHVDKMAVNYKGDISLLPLPFAFGENNTMIGKVVDGKMYTPDADGNYDIPGRTSPMVIEAVPHLGG